MRRTDRSPSWRGKVGTWLRHLADQVDHRGAPKISHWTMTFEEGEGVRFREDGWGCKLAYLGDDEYERAFTEADTEWGPPLPLSATSRADVGNAASIPMPAGLAAVYEEWHRAAEEIRPVRVPRGPVRFPIRTPDQ